MGTLRVKLGWDCTVERTPMRSVTLQCIVGILVSCCDIKMHCRNTRIMFSFSQHLPPYFLPLRISIFMECTYLQQNFLKYINFCIFNPFPMLSSVSMYVRCQYVSMLVCIKYHEISYTAIMIYITITWINKLYNVIPCSTRGLSTWYGWWVPLRHTAWKYFERQ